MTQLLVRKLDEDIKPKLKQQAARQGRSLEEHVRLLLRAEVDRSDPLERPEEGLGTQISKMFEGIGLDDDEEFDGIMDGPVRAARFED